MAKHAVIAGSGSPRADGGFSHVPAARLRGTGIRSLAILLAVIAVGAGSSAAAGASTFVPTQRVNSLALQGGTDTFASQNAFGGAFVGTALTNMQSGVALSAADGSTSWVLEMRDLTDLSGTSDSAFHVGVVNGSPAATAGNPATYEGTSDLDWWYDPSLADVDAEGFARHRLPATFTAMTLDAGPGDITLTTLLGGPLASLAVSNARLRAVSGDSSAPLESSNGFPPGHLPEEELPDSLTSFESMSSGQLAGGISAGSLADTPVPPSLLGSTACTENYSPTNTMLDLVVGGCRSFGVLTQVKRTQPDTFDPAVGSGTYAFSEDSSHHVTACAHDGETASLDDCLAAAAFSVYFRFTTDRVILRGPCAPGSYSADGSFPCTPADPGYFVEGSGSTTQTLCPLGRTSVAPGATSCAFFLTTTAAACSKNPVRIGVTTSCTATIADQIDGPPPTGEVDWSHPSGSGSFSSGSCVLEPSGGIALCSVPYRPAPASAGKQLIGAHYAGDDDHIAGGRQFTLKVIRRATSTTVVCKPKRVTHGRSTVCTAKVADTSGGVATAPTGKVKWSARTRFGAFSAVRCRLADHDGVRSCRVTFKTRSKVRGKFAVAATFAGDASHTGSAGKAHPVVV